MGPMPSAATIGALQKYKGTCGPGTFVIETLNGGTGAFAAVSAINLEASAAVKAGTNLL